MHKRWELKESWELRESLEWSGIRAWKRRTGLGSKSSARRAMARKEAERAVVCAERIKIELCPAVAGSGFSMRIFDADGVELEPVCRCRVAEGAKVRAGTVRVLGVGEGAAGQGKERKTTRAPVCVCGKGTQFDNLTVCW